MARLPTKKVLTLRELQMAKRVLKGTKVPPCQKELGALLSAMDKKDRGDAKADLRVFQVALENCLQQAVRKKRWGSSCGPFVMYCV